MFLEERNKPPCQSDETFGRRQAHQHGLHILSAEANKPALHIYFTAALPLIATTNTAKMENPNQCVQSKSNRIPIGHTVETLDSVL